MSGGGKPLGKGKIIKMEILKLILPKNKKNNVHAGLHGRVCGTANREQDSMLRVSPNELYIIYNQNL